MTDLPFKICDFLKKIFKFFLFCFESQSVAECSLLKEVMTVKELEGPCGKHVPHSGEETSPALQHRRLEWAGVMQGLVIWQCSAKHGMLNPKNFSRTAFAVFM